MVKSKTPFVSVTAQVKIWEGIVGLFLVCVPTQAADSVCAVVNLEILQNLPYKLSQRYSNGGLQGAYELKLW